MPAGHYSIRRHLSGAANSIERYSILWRLDNELDCSINAGRTYNTGIVIHLAREWLGATAVYRVDTLMLEVASHRLPLGIVPRNSREWSMYAREFTKVMMRMYDDYYISHYQYRG